MDYIREEGGLGSGGVRSYFVFGFQFLAISFAFSKISFKLSIYILFSIKKRDNSTESSRLVSLLNDFQVVRMVELLGLLWFLDYIRGKGKGSSDRKRGGTDITLI